MAANGPECSPSWITQAKGLGNETVILLLTPFAFVKSRILLVKKNSRNIFDVHGFKQHCEKMVVATKSQREQSVGNHL